MKNDFNKIKEEIRLSKHEKREAFSVIESFMKENPLQSVKTQTFKPTPSPYNWFMFRNAGMAFAVLLIVAGGTTSFSAESAVPGDALYQIKIGINEKVIESLSFSSEEKARTHIAFSQRRIDEIERAADTDITPEDLQVAVDSLIDHNEKAISNILATSDGGEDQTSKELSQEFEMVLDSYDSGIPDQDSAPVLAIDTSADIAPMAMTLSAKMAAPAEIQPVAEETPLSPTDEILTQVEFALEMHREIVEDHIDDIESQAPQTEVMIEQIQPATTSTSTILNEASSEEGIQ